MNRAWVMGNGTGDALIFTAKVAKFIEARGGVLLRLVVSCDYSCAGWIFRRCTRHCCDGHRAPAISA